MSDLGDCQREDKRISGILRGLWDERALTSGKNNPNNHLLRALYRETSNQPVLSLIPSVDQLMIIFSNADFASSDAERVEVAGIFRTYIFKRDPFPMASQHEGRDLACRCLVSLGLFKQRMEYHCRYHEAPSPSFYRQVGIAEFDCINRRDLSHNFVNWENFFSEFFPLTSSVSE